MYMHALRETSAVSDFALSRVSYLWKASHQPKSTCGEPRRTFCVASATLENEKSCMTDEIQARNNRNAATRLTCRQGSLLHCCTHIKSVYAPAHVTVSVYGSLHIHIAFTAHTGIPVWKQVLSQLPGVGPQKMQPVQRSHAGVTLHTPELLALFNRQTLRAHTCVSQEGIHMCSRILMPTHACVACRFAQHPQSTATFPFRCAFRSQATKTTLTVREG